MSKHMAGEFSHDPPTDEQKQRLETYKSIFFEEFPSHLLHALHPSINIGWYAMTRDQAILVLKHLDAIAKDRVGQLG